ncbi:flavodoxin domain-containing protein, partial [bacterium]|nr:flavodoxin domain-containing protein [bacterium]
MKILIVYYSKTGKTKEIAHSIANELADGNEVKLRRIKMKDEKNLLTTYLLDTKKAIRREKPEIEVIDYGHKEYDLILLGTPVWSTKPAPAINTYLGRSDFKNKRVALFATLRMMGGEKVIRILTEE